jgi:hypothetical protein
MQTRNSERDVTHLSFASRVAAQRLARADSRRRPEGSQGDDGGKPQMPPRRQDISSTSTSPAYASAISQAEAEPAEAQPLARSPPTKEAVDTAVAHLQAQHDKLAEAASLADLPISVDESLHCTWHEYGGAELEPLLAFTTLVDARWLLAFAKRRAGDGAALPILPAWHQLPAEAEVSVDDLRRSTWHGGLPIGALSYGWATHAHPDPTGETLQNLIPLLEAICMHCDELEETTGLHMSWGIFWDFISLPQPPSLLSSALDQLTAEHLARFQLARQHVDVWYACKWTYSIVLDTPMPPSAVIQATHDRRAWVLFELMLSAIVKDANCCLLLSQLSGHVSDWPSMRNECTAAARSRAPMSPDQFDRMLIDGVARESAEAGSGIRLSVADDLHGLLLPRYKDAFLRLLGSAEVLDFQELGWDDSQITTLATALEYAHAHGATAKLEQIQLSHNAVGDDGFQALATMLAGGMGSSLRELELEYNDASPEGRRLVKAASRSRGITCHT